MDLFNRKGLLFRPVQSGFHHPHQPKLLTHSRIRDSSIQLLSSQIPKKFIQPFQRFAVRPPISAFPSSALCPLPSVLSPFTFPLSPFTFPLSPFSLHSVPRLPCLNRNPRSIYLTYQWVILFKVLWSKGTGFNAIIDT